MNTDQKNEIVQGIITTAPTHANLLLKEFIREKPTYPDENIVNCLHEEEVTLIVNKFKKVDRKFLAVMVGKTTITTELAKEACTQETVLPERYQEYASVFSEKEAHHLPPPQPYNHPIELDDSFVPKVGKVYPLTPWEQKATEDFLEENLKSGKICPLNSPSHLSSLLIRKMPPMLSDPARTIAMSIVTPSKTHISSP